jgi:Reverse transcriptase (RNA-dependent DNA polymerase)
MTPQEAWSGEKPTISHLRVFGSVAYAQIPEAKRKKLDDREKKCIFISNSETSKAYKVYNPVTNKVVVSRDVIFSENEAWTWPENETNENVLVEESEEGQQQQQEQPNTPTSEASSSNDSENLSSRRIRTLDDIYMRTQQIDGDETNLLSLYGYRTLNFNDVVQDDNWRTAIEEEIRAIEMNSTWKLVSLPKDKKTIGVKWVYKIKRGADDSINRYKTRLVAKG